MVCGLHVSAHRFVVQTNLRERISPGKSRYMAAMKYLNRCAKRCKGFLVRFGIVALALVAMYVVLLNTGEVVSFGEATSRIAEALGYAAADTLASD